MNYLDFIKNMNDTPEKYNVYEKSINKIGDTVVFMAEVDGETMLISTKDVGFIGEKKGEAIVAPLTHENANVLRTLFPFTAPTQVLGKEKSFGVGDRLGNACHGHIMVFDKYEEVYPVFAQQSIRELTLTERTYENVLDCASFAVYRDGFKRGFGADGDHLKRAEDVKYALDLGFSMITLDCSDFIRNDIGRMSDAEVACEYTADAGLEAKYLGKKFNIGGLELEFSTEEFRRIVLIYKKAIDFAVSIYSEFLRDGRYRADFEISIDETSTPTTPLQHFFVAKELINAGVKFATIAPRFCGEFQKGIDYIGDIGQFEAEMKVHAEIARQFGYKLSIHSGSDKFSVFPIIGRETRGVFHVKTAGTNWLEAVKVVSMVDPALYRELHQFALESFAEASTYYHVTTNIANIPDVDTLTDAELPALFNLNDARQLIHITYGLILTAKNPDGTSRFKDNLYRIWKENEATYNASLFSHIGHHMELLLGK